MSPPEEVCLSPTLSACSPTHSLLTHLALQAPHCLACITTMGPQLVATQLPQA